MADLDNFFAKKDKKKKGGKKFTGTSTAEMVKALETPEPPPTAEPEKKEFQIDLLGSKSTDDEWHEVEEKEKDLEGLKIRSLRVDDTVEGGGKAAADKTDEDSDTNEQSEPVGSSPWQVVTSQAELEEEIEREASPSPPPPPPPAADEAEKKPSAYVPPYLRNQPKEPYRSPGSASWSGGGSAYRAPGRRGNAPPDIENTEAFPSLGGTSITNKS